MKKAEVILDERDIERFWEVVVPYFGLDSSFDYDANPSRIKEYLEDYDRQENATQAVYDDAKALIELLDASGPLVSEGIKCAARKLRLSLQAVEPAETPVSEETPRG